MQKRIIASILLSVLVILGTLGVISYLSVREGIDRSLNDHLKLAQIVANHTDAVLQANLNRLFDLSLSGAVDLEDGDWAPEEGALREAYEYSLFADGIFLLDLEGNILLTHPAGKKRGSLAGLPFVQQVVSSARPVVSDVYTIPETKRKLIYVLVPLKNRSGRMVGVAGGEINPTSHMLNQIMKNIPAGSETFLELIDSRGTVIASNNPSRVFSCVDRNRFLEQLIQEGRSSVTTCHRCHEGESGDGAAGVMTRTTDILAFAPLLEAPWGVSVREPEELVFASSSRLKRRFLVIGLIAMGSSLILAFGMSRSIVHPIQLLKDGADRIARGNLTETVIVASKDEIGQLGASFETMRMKLADSLERIQQANVHLEHRVEKRTEALRQHRQRLSFLLQEVIAAQENERKRIARELHDETSQSLTALGFAIDVAQMEHDKGQFKPETLQGFRKRVDGVLQGVKLLVHNLRPPVIDDLGLEDAVQALLEEHLTPRSIRHFLMVTPEFRQVAARLRHPESRSQAELMLFRIIQEAVVNVARHSTARNVMVILKCENYRVQAYIEDDGRPFDAERMLAAAERGELHCFGLMGMKERAALLGGTIDIRSSPESEGTLIALDIPLSSLEAQNG